MDPFHARVEYMRRLNNAYMHGVLSVCAMIACVLLGLLLGYVLMRAEGHARLDVHGAAAAPRANPEGESKTPSSAR